MSLDQITIKSNIKNYAVTFFDAWQFIEQLASLDHVFFVIDAKVWDLYGERQLKSLAQADNIKLVINEDVKSLATVQTLYQKLLKITAKKNLTLVAIGGGITQDLVGFVASTLYRGVNWLFVPTTLLAQADSCIGAKTSLNYQGYKNVVGTFYPPSKIYIQTSFLQTLTELDYFSGIGEIAKLHIMAGKEKINDFLANLNALIAKDDLVLSKIIKQALLIKQGYIEKDEFDQGQRNFLNYGHGFGHALESASNYAIPHGQAVLLGILFANLVAVARGWLEVETEKLIREQVVGPILKAKAPLNALATDKLIAAMKQDKKRSTQNLALVMLCTGETMRSVSDLTEAEASKTIDSLKAFFAKG